MAPENNTSMDNKPEFFKILFQDPLANLMIPRKFLTNLPNKLQKLATLFSPSGKFWHVKVDCIDQDMYFQKGWSEFAKAHDLQTGDMMVFRYVGNMIFKVKVFDTTGCLKDYSLRSHARHTPTYIEIETSSETRDQTSSESSHEIKTSSPKKRKLAKNQAHEIDKRKKGSTSKEIVQDKEKTETRSDPTVRSRQFETILRPYCFSSRVLMNVPKAFCLNNGLLRRCTIFLTRNSSGGMIKWPVQFNLGPTRGHLTKGWKEFREAAALKQGDQCIFRLESENSIVVDVVPPKSNSPRERKRKAIGGSTSSDVVLEKKQTQLPKQYSRPILEWESTVRQYHLTYSYQTLNKKFCLDNNLTSKRDVTLRDITGKDWCVKFSMCASEGRLCKGWTEFSHECGLKVGDKCIFKLIEKDVMLVRVVKQ